MLEVYQRTNGVYCNNSIRDDPSNCNGGHSGTSSSSCDDWGRALQTNVYPTNPLTSIKPKNHRIWNMNPSYTWGVRGCFQGMHSKTHSQSRFLKSVNGRKGSTQIRKGPGPVHRQVQDQWRYFCWGVGLQMRAELHSWAPHHGIPD